MTDPCQTLLSLWGEVHDLEVSAQLLSWDQETMMPGAGGGARAAAAATIAGQQHRLLVADGLSDALAAVEQGDEVGRAHARIARRRVERARRIPEDLVRELAAAASTSVELWRQAREANDFAAFAPSLRRMVELKRLQAQALGVGEDLYDSLLDEFEPGVGCADLEICFGELERELPPLIAAVEESGIVVDESAALGDFDLERQFELARWLAERIGFDFRRGRLDRSTHPFCCGLDPGDVRLTWRADRGDLRPGLFGLLHETGHGLYEQGLPEHWTRTPLGAALSFGVHESQSRLWENLVGRHRSFLTGLQPRLAELFPQLDGIDLEALWRTLHLVRPSLIRVEADEVTYNLHILARYRLEIALIDGDLDVKDLPAAWNESYRRLLGITPANDREGVLQDIHWASGLFGYFPTYTLGNLLAAQLYVAAKESLSSLEQDFEALETAPLLAWLQRHVHSHGSLYDAEELTRRATGRELSSRDFLVSVRSKAERIYGVRRGT